MTPITRQEVWQAVAGKLRGRAWPEAKLPTIDELDLPVSLPARARRSLRVTSFCWDAARQRSQFRLECDTSGECLPFLAYMRMSLGGENAGSCQRRAPGQAQRAPAKTTVRAGDRATAVFAAGNLRMSARVTCLERGRMGEVIRVRNEAGHIFRARVTNPVLLEASHTEE